MAIFCLTIEVRYLNWDKIKWLQNFQLSLVLTCQFLLLQQNVTEATRYFEHAVESDPRNFPAAMDLLQVYLASPESNHDKIEELFQKKFADVSLSEAKAGIVHVTKGIQLFMQGNRSEALEQWHLALQKTDFDIKYFQVS